MWRGCGGGEAEKGVGAWWSRSLVGTVWWGPHTMGGCGGLAGRCGFGVMRGRELIGGGGAQGCVEGAQLTPRLQGLMFR